MPHDPSPQPDRPDGLYHCVQRCVRRAFLCGVYAYSGRSFEHRKGWIVQRLGLLAECFAVSIHAYAVMSHHLHIALQLAPDAVAGWSDADVAARWARPFPPRQDSEEAADAKRRQLIDEAERLKVVRGRLCDLSWLMRCLAEPIARQANREDRCKGRFWEGRLKAQRLCSKRALLAAMAYVDLNPVRAGIADGLEDSAHTSVAARIASPGKTAQALGERLGPILSMLQPPLAITTADYLQLLDWTDRQLAPGKRGQITGDTPACLRDLESKPERWATRVRAVGSGYWRAIGSAEQLIELALQIGQRWLKGVRLAERLG